MTRLLAISLGIIILTAPASFAQQCVFDKTKTAHGQGTGPTPAAAQTAAQADLATEVTTETSALDTWANQQTCDVRCPAKFVGNVSPFQTYGRQPLQRQSVDGV